MIIAIDPARCGQGVGLLYIMAMQCVNRI